MVTKNRASTRVVQAPDDKAAPAPGAQATSTDMMERIGKLAEGAWKEIEAVVSRYPELNRQDVTDPKRVVEGLSAVLAVVNKYFSDQNAELSKNPAEATKLAEEAKGANDKYEEFVSTLLDQDGNVKPDVAAKLEAKGMVELLKESGKFSDRELKVLTLMSDDSELTMLAQQCIGTIQALSSAPADDSLVSYEDDTADLGDGSKYSAKGSRAGSRALRR